MMNIQIFILSPFLCFTLVINLVNIQSSLSNPSLYADCSPNSFTCGNLTASYPFWGGEEEPLLPGCGHPELKLTCENDHITTTIMINDVKYRVLDVNDTAQILKIARDEYFQEGICGLRSLDTTTIIDPALFVYPSDEYCQNLTLLYDCPAPSRAPGLFACTEINGLNFIKEGDHDAGKCRHSVVVPVPRTLFEKAKVNSSSLELALKQGLEVQWKLNGVNCEKCRESKGICKYDDDPENQTVCICPNQGGLSGPCPPPIQPPIPSKPTSDGPGTSNKLHWSKAVAIWPIGVAVLVVIVVAIFGIIFCMRMSQTWNDEDVEALIRNYGSLAPKRYKYPDVKKMTNSFTDKVGQGGFGVVYRGKLNDGRVVAVKVLKESKGSGQEFMNEVDCISRTSHINVVTLLGFCYERNKRALIYDFMPNGSLDKFIHNQGSLSGTTDHHLELKILSHIVVGVARGLEYLHRGCNTRIVHFDIKPHNILLDEDFCPKISDFGLAKLCKKKESIISMLDARGTIGYIAPEVFCRNFGGVSHKSDVYGFGMMVLEMVGVRNNINDAVGGSQSSEIYFPDWIYKQLEGTYEDFTLHGIVNDREEEEMARKMILVSLWCIQTNPSDRPSMSKVVEMLEGDLVESLQVPPKPSQFSSSIRSLQQFSSTESQSRSVTSTS